jgi:hypothetical protein
MTILWRVGETKSSVKLAPMGLWDHVLGYFQPSPLRQAQGRLAASSGQALRQSSHGTWGRLYGTEPWSNGAAGSHALTPQERSTRSPLEVAVNGCAIAGVHQRWVEGAIWANKKAAISGGLLVNAGNHLRSHTLTRAVPSAQRGLTSVFGMGTGVTLAVYSPANLGVLLDLFTSSVCSDNLNRAVKTHL